MTLNKKLLRDLLDNKGANIAAMVVIAIGLMMYTSFSMVMDTLLVSKAEFYSASNFPDGFVSVISMPRSKIEDIRGIDGIDKAYGRLMEDIRIEDQFGAPSNETKYLRMISTGTSIGNYVLMEGNEPRDGELEGVFDPMFAQANGLKVGDSVPVIAYGRKLDIRISGIGRSAEYIYALRSQAEIYPDPVIFGTVFIPLSSLSSITGKNHFTDIIYTLDENTSFNKIRQQMERELRPYGFMGIIEREDQVSDLMLNTELNQLESTTVALPLVFLSVASMILYIMIKRMVEKQRGQIGILKAFGYSNLEVSIHFTLYAVAIGFLGGILGGLLGMALSNPLINLYRPFFNMPLYDTIFSIKYFFQSILLSCVFGVIAGYRGSKGAIKLSPAEAMREREPVTGSRSIFEKIPFILLVVTSRGKMALRNISRSPARSFFVLIGIAFTFALSVVPWTFMGQIDVMLFDRYDEVEKYDVRVYLSGMSSLELSEKELLRQEDVTLSEGILDISGFITNAHIREAVPITGLRRDNKLYTVLDDSKNRIYIEKGGIVLPRRVADRLNVKTGDKVTFESPYMRNKDEKEEIRVIDVIDQSVGINAYMEIEYLSDILGYPPAANSILLASREGVAESLKVVYEDSSVITGINDSNEMIEKMRQFLESYTGTMFYVALIAIIMGFAIVYNSYVIILSERKHELSSLMVLGMSEKEVLSIITFEQWFIAFFGMIFGIPLAQATITAIGEAASSDMFTMNIKIDLNSIIIAMIITVFSIVIAQIMASRKIKKLNIADALKSNE
ncbi:putative ABC transport system permease protein [Acetoanaerobium pronyense]|uniref:ABC transport system permease protein n=1 Tax=Acetoanaerobium pronyense TaxID=1482736 RepID=A0ABS4KHW0_9FIRM|nr:FtsX-like permease family protein [Acetoanaerobium pronyense]MBP2027377.1 putative ABC transport system permease protein [Acetoanaerobium pronyense]